MLCGRCGYDSGFIPTIPDPVESKDFTRERIQSDWKFWNADETDLFKLIFEEVKDYEKFEGHAAKVATDHVIRYRIAKGVRSVVKHDLFSKSFITLLMVHNKLIER